MFFGVISWRSGSATCCRRQRLRSAIATARLAASCPTMCLSSSETISSGVMWDDMAARNCTSRAAAGRRSRTCDNAAHDVAYEPVRKRGDIRCARARAVRVRDLEARRRGADAAGPRPRRAIAQPVVRGDGRGARVRLPRRRAGAARRRQHVPGQLPHRVSRGRQLPLAQPLLGGSAVGAAHLDQGTGRPHARVLGQSGRQPEQLRRVREGRVHRQGAVAARALRGHPLGHERGPGVSRTAQQPHRVRRVRVQQADPYRAGADPWVFSPTARFS